MNSHHSNTKTLDLVVSIPGSDELRLVPDITATLTFAELLIKLGKVWDLDAIDDCAISYCWEAISKDIVIATSSEWIIHYKRNFGRPPAREQEPLMIRFFKRVAPSGAE